VVRAARRAQAAVGIKVVARAVRRPTVVVRVIRVAMAVAKQAKAAIKVECKPVAVAAMAAEILVGVRARARR